MAERLRAFAGRWPVALVAALAGVLFADLAGLLVGALAGAALDTARRRWPLHPLRWRRESLGDGTPEFLIGVFAWSGAVAKADGRVSEAEIAVARGLMRELGLEVSARRLAIDVFRRGKRPDFPARRVARRLVTRFNDEPDTLNRVLTLVARVALADGRVEPAQVRCLERLALLLGLSPAEVERLLRRARQAPTAVGRSALDEALETLGVPSDASDETVRHAYRRLVSRHHPDRVLARQGSEAEVREAADHTRRVRRAYDVVRRARGG